MRALHCCVLFCSTVTGCASSLSGSSKEPVVSPKISRAERVEAVLPLVQAAAERHGVPPDLVLGVIQVESSFRPKARSRVGASGLMQLMPRTAASLARRLKRPDYQIDDPSFNIEAGTYYLAYLLDLFGDDARWALAGYNAGPTRALKWRRRGRLPGQVRRYVATVLATRNRFTAWLERTSPGRGGPMLAGTSSPAATGPGTGPGTGTGTGTDQDLELDQSGLRALLREKEQLYGERPDEPLPTVNENEGENEGERARPDADPAR